MTQLMNNVLVLGKVESIKMRIQKVPTKILNLINEVVNTHFTNQVDNRFLEIQVKGKEKDLAVDPNLINLLLTNVINNAFKYSVGSGNPKLLLIFEPTELQMIVKDKGVGIPPHELNQLFQSFYRAQNTKGIPGSGLGLVISKEIVELHGGKISITCQDSTEVKISLPYDSKHE